MRSVRVLFAAGIASTLVLISSIAVAGAQGSDAESKRREPGDARQSVRVLLEDLSSPKGLGVTGDRDLVIGQGAFGPPGPVLVFSRHGSSKGTTEEVTEPLGLLDVAISPVDGTGWGIGPDATPAANGHLYHQLADGTIDDVLDITAYQAGDPDKVDRDVPPNAIESNAYGLTIARNGHALIADAAGNDIIRVTPDGVATTVARFDVQMVATDHLPADFPGGPLPPAIEAESVPTTVTIGPDGAIYVGELKGFPFRPGSSNIWRIEPDAQDAWCSTDEADPTGACSLYRTGFTAIQDLAFGKRNDRFYVYELAADGVLAFEAALEPESGVPFPAAVLLEVKHNRGHDKHDREKANGEDQQAARREKHGKESRTELAAGQLSQPGGVVVVGGKVYVTDGVFTGGRLLSIGQHGWHHDDGDDDDDS